MRSGIDKVPAGSTDLRLLERHYIPLGWCAALTGSLPPNSPGKITRSFVAPDETTVIYGEESEVYRHCG